MRHSILALAVLLAGAVSLASADYIVIITNVGESTEDDNQMIPGLAGGVPGMPGAPGGAGIAGGGGMRGGPGGMGMRGGFPGGAGMRGGFPGMPGGMGMRGGYGGMPGMPGSYSDEEIDADPYNIVAVVEVQPLQKRSHQFLNLGEKTPIKVPVPVWHQWGQSNILARTSNTRVVLLRQADGKPMPTVAKRFKDKFDETFKKPSTQEALDLAEWALAHGLVNKFAVVMDKLAEIDKDNDKVVAYLKLREDLKKEVKSGLGAESLLSKLMDTYKVAELPGYHYVLLQRASDAPDTAKPYLNRLEDAFRGFYYWFVLRGMVLPMPQERLIAVRTEKPEDFKRYHDILTSGPVVADGYFARRENVSVFSSRRLDPPYEALEKTSEVYWKEGGYSRQKSLHGGRGSSPRTAPPLQVAEVQMTALLLKAMEEESEQTSITHDTGRQMLFATGLLPANVAAPEWVLFGMGSFFETPPESPWGGPGAPSFYYLPRFKEMKGKLAKTPYEALRKVVTDQYFRQAALVPEKEMVLKETAVRKARTAAWSLTYFLAQKKLPGLRQYFKELSKLPRDLELGEEVLLNAFARAFDAVGADHKPDQAKLAALANQWYSYIQNTHLESEDLLREIHKYYKEMHEIKTQQNNNGQNGQNGQGNQGPNPYGGQRMQPVYPGGVGPRGGYPGGRVPRGGYPGGRGGS